MGTRVVVPSWLLLAMAFVVGANVVAGAATTVTIGLMQSPSPFALAVREQDMALLPLWRCIGYPLLTALVVWYLWPLVRFFRCAGAEQATATVQRRAVNGPFVMAGAGFSGWVSSAIFFPGMTIVHFGRWAPELASQQVLSPLVNGFLAATASYLVTDWLFRARVLPHVLPHGGASEIGGTAALGVGARLGVFLVAVAFVPLFTMLGLIRAAWVRLDGGWEVGRVMPELVRAGTQTFALYVALGLVLTILLARTFTRPLAEVTNALRRVRAGELDQLVRVTSADEIGVLEETVNAMSLALNERERILQTFGRAVDPAIRDRLLAGDLREEGEVRVASILFCDLRDFTGFAERTEPRELVRMLNAFFDAMTSWASECGGFVNKFIGDGLLVVFGLLDANATDGPAPGAAAAVRCALGMRRRLAPLNAERARSGARPLEVKIGVHTGPVLAGTIGAADRHEYTVIGDAVNVAARLEDLCRDRGCDGLVSAATWELAREGGVALPDVRPEAVSLRGRGAPVEAYRIADQSCQVTANVGSSR